MSKAKLSEKLVFPRLFFEQKFVQETLKKPIRKSFFNDWSTRYIFYDHRVMYYCAWIHTYCGVSGHWLPFVPSKIYGL